MHPVVSEVKVRMLVSAGVAFLLGAGIIAWPYLAHPHYHYHWLNNAGGGLLLLMGLSLIAGGRKVVLDENGWRFEYLYGKTVFYPHAQIVHVTLRSNIAGSISEPRHQLVITPSGGQRRMIISSVTNTNFELLSNTASMLYMGRFEVTQGGGILP